MNMFLVITVVEITVQNLNYAEKYKEENIIYEPVTHMQWSSLGVGILDIFNFNYSYLYF